jgi:hypothetical protein
MRVFKRENPPSSQWVHEWWVQDENYTWWCSVADILGNVYHWVCIGRNEGLIVYNKRLYESSELAYLVIQGEPITTYLPEGLI